MKLLLKLLLISFALIVGCSVNNSVEVENPEWLTELIQKLETEPVANPPAFIARYGYKGQLVYYLPPRCCDVPSTLYDGNGNIICHPDGGISGMGDGRCVDFFGERKNERIIWNDQRTYH